MLWWLVGGVAALVVLGTIGAWVTRDDRPWTDDPEPEDAETRVTNRVVRLLLRGATREAIILIDRHLPGTEGPFRASLIGRRAACHFMNGDLASAASDYETCVALEPDGAIHLANLAETYEKLGRRDDALRCAHRVLSLRSDAAVRDTAGGIVRRIATEADGPGAG